MHVKLDVQCNILQYCFFSDIDECATGDYTCHVNADCSNTNGSFMCSCIFGYSGDGTTCSGKLTYNMYRTN